MTNYYTSKKLLHDPLDFVERMLILTRKRYHIHKMVYIALNILLIILTFTSVVIFTIMIWGRVLKPWFLLTSVSISATSSFILSILNLFVVKKKMNIFHERHWRIVGEINHYHINAKHYRETKQYSKEYKLFLNVSIIVGIEKAMESDNHE